MKPTRSNHLFLAQLDDYLTEQKQRNRSPHTLAAYQRDLLDLQELLPNITTPTRKDFAVAFRKLSQKGLNASSLARKLSAWRQYCDFLRRQGYLADDPVVNIKAPKRPVRLPRAIDREILNTVLDNRYNDEEGALFLRDQAVAELFYGSGLRLSELCRLNMDDVFLDDAWLNVMGKGNKQRQVPLTRTSIRALQDWLAVRVCNANEQALFTGQHGQRISPRQIAKRLSYWAHRHDSQQHISPHRLRHSFASHILQASHDLRAVQDLLGHENLSSTQIYTSLDFDHLAQVYDQTHPRAKRRKD